MGAYQAEKFGFAKGQSDLVLRTDGKWFLLVTVDVPEDAPVPTTDFLGVDLGVENIAADSDGEIYSGKDVEAKRFAYARRRKAIGNKTRGAGRQHGAAVTRRSNAASGRKPATAAMSITSSANESSRRLNAPNVNDRTV